MKNTNSVRMICATRRGVIQEPQRTQCTQRTRGTRRTLCGLREPCGSREPCGRSLVSPYRLAGAPRGWQRAPAFPDVCLVLVTEILERGEYRRRGGVAEGAQRFAGDVRRDARQ